jgi:hypothetical protein
MPAKSKPPAASLEDNHARQDAAYDDLLQPVSSIVEKMQGLSQMAASQYEPVVEAIIRSRSRDVNHIEHTLDHLLDFCHSPAPLAVFKRLCRYYWTLDPAATARQINAYREMWDSDENASDQGGKDA